MGDPVAVARQALIRTKEETVAAKIARMTEADEVEGLDQETTRLTLKSKQAPATILELR